MSRRVRDYWIKYIRRDDVPASIGWTLLYETVSSVAIAVIIIFAVFTFVFRAVGVIGESMLPTLNDGDWLAVRSINTSINRNDIVIITQPNILDESLVKRVIALEGDEVNIDFDTHEVFVNGEILDEPFILEPTQEKLDVEFPVTVPEGCVFVMGDNRNNSLDSRSSIVGFIDERYILGVAKYRIYPLGNFEIN